MSNQLHFDLKILTRSEDDLCILVPHEDSKWGTRKEDQERTNQTRRFCNWIRKQFPNVPTEFRFVNKKWSYIRTRSIYGAGRARRVNCDKHFVAYGLTRNQLMMIKLAWQFKTRNCRLTTATMTDPDAYIIDSGPAGFLPTEALVERMAKKAKTKPIDEL